VGTEEEKIKLKNYLLLETEIALGHQNETLTKQLVAGCEQVLHSSR
jgi:hypothetical protein